MNFLLNLQAMKLRQFILLAALFVAFSNVQAQLFYSLIGQTEATFTDS